jgi:hypothetical protein
MLANASDHSPSVVAVFFRGRRVRGADFLLGFAALSSGAVSSCDSVASDISGMIAAVTSDVFFTGLRPVRERPRGWTARPALLPFRFPARFHLARRSSRYFLLRP